MAPLLDYFDPTPPRVGALVHRGGKLYISIECTVGNTHALCTEWCYLVIRTSIPQSTLCTIYPMHIGELHILVRGDASFATLGAGSTELT